MRLLLTITISGCFIVGLLGLGAALANRHEPTSEACITPEAIQTCAAESTHYRMALDRCWQDLTAHQSFGAGQILRGLEEEE